MENLDRMLLSELEDDNKLGVIIFRQKYGLMSLWLRTKHLGIHNQYFHHWSDSYKMLRQEYYNESDFNKFPSVRLTKPNVIPSKFQHKYRNR